MKYRDLVQFEPIETIVHNARLKQDYVLLILT